MSSAIEEIKADAIIHCAAWTAVVDAEFCYKCDDFYHADDESGLAWNDPDIGIEWPELSGEYDRTASGAGYHLEDETPRNLSEKNKKWKGLKETFRD